MTTSAPEPARIVYTPAAEGDLRDLRTQAARFRVLIDTLAQRPDRGHLLTRKPLVGVYSLNLTDKGGAFRAVYRWRREENLVVVFAIGPHKTVYDAAAKRYPPSEPQT